MMTKKKLKIGISEVIGNERGSSILSALYLMRHDPNTIVSHAALNTWKLVVVNTPKTISI